MSDWKNVQYKDGKMRTGEGGGGGGSSTFAGLDDVSFNNIQNGQVPKYNSTTQKWENADESGGGGTVTDVEVDGVSVVNPQGVAEITMPTPPSVPDKLSDLSDVQFNNLQDHQPLRYNSVSQKWVNGADNYPPLIYSDEEREIGVWRDGKPLYQKVFQSTITGDGNNEIASIAGLNADNYYVTEAFLLTSNASIPSGYNNGSNTAYFYVYTRTSDNTIRAISKGYASVVVHIVFRYTKTTDVAGSGKYTTYGGIAHHYSTSEQVIGTWIDGKPIYEKTISKNNIRIENAVQFNHDIANLGICVRAFVFMYDSSTGISYNFEAGADSGVNNQSIGVRVYPNYIYFQGGQDFSASTNRTWYFTLQYTKTQIEIFS